MTERDALAPEGLPTEVAFELPRGLVDGAGRTHRQGIMRLATAGDELAAGTDPRARAHPPYLTVLLLERTVVCLGDLPVIDAEVVESLFAVDFAFLHELYRALNEQAGTEAEVTCPACGSELTVTEGFDALAVR